MSDLVFYVILIAGLISWAVLLPYSLGNFPGTRSYREIVAKNLKQTLDGLSSPIRSRQWRFRTAVVCACHFVSFFVLNFGIASPRALYWPGMSDGARALAYIAYPMPLTLVFAYMLIRWLKWRLARVDALLEQGRR